MQEDGCAYVVTGTAPECSAPTLHLAMEGSQLSTIMMSSASEVLATNIFEANEAYRPQYAPHPVDFYVQGQRRTERRGTHRKFGFTSRMTFFDFERCIASSE